MENSIQIIGSESSVIYYNLNKQFSTLKKVIITKEVLLSSFENEKIKNLIKDLQTSDYTTYKQITKDNSETFETNIKSELYQEIQDSLNKLSGNYVDVKLKDYNFMNSVSNAKFNIVLRCESFSITKYYAEKGTLLTNMRNLIKKYLEFEGNVYRLSRLDNFQIEITESEEIYKHIFLKKENTSLTLAASFGFPKNDPIDHSIGSEFYVSKNEEFQFFKNNQNTAVFRDHNKLIEKEINKQDKILSNEDLVLINEKTKNIDDALIECYLSAKGKFRIANLSLIENGFNNYSEHGFIINKSSNHYDKISLLVNKESFEEETINPAYWLIKNDTSIKELMDNILFVEKIDGLVFTQNFYTQFLDKLGIIKNLDIVFFNKALQKSLEEKIDWENVDIESSMGSQRDLNPFKGIITDQNKQKDEMLERLKNVDLSTPTRQATQEPANDVDRSAVQNAVNGITGSSGSSFNSTNNSKMDWGQPTNNKKRSAIDMLMDSARDHKEKVEENKARQHEALDTQTQNPNTQNGYQEIGQQQSQPSPFDNPVPTGISGHSFSEKYLNNDTPKEPQYQEQPQQSYQEEEKSPFETYNYNEPQPTAPTPQEPTQTQPQIARRATTDHSKYHNVHAVEIIVEPYLDDDAYLVDQNTISQMKDGKNYFLSVDPNEMKNPNLNYILPIRLNNHNVRNCNLLIGSAQDFFLIDTHQVGVEYFASISEINDEIKQSFVKELTLKVGKIGLMCQKKDLDLIAENIHKIKSIHVQDVRTEQDLQEVKNKILSFEKRHLMNNH